MDKNALPPRPWSWNEFNELLDGNGKLIILPIIRGERAQIKVDTILKSMILLIPEMIEALKEYQEQFDNAPE